MLLIILAHGVEKCGKRVSRILLGSLVLLFPLCIRNR